MIIAYRQDGPGGCAEVYGFIGIDDIVAIPVLEGATRCAGVHTVIGDKISTDTGGLTKNVVSTIIVVRKHIVGLSLRRPSSKEYHSCQ